MCAIFGIGFMKDHIMRSDTVIKGMLHSLFIENMMRGRTATGVAFVKKNKISVVKKAVKADDFINTEEYKAAEMENVVFETKTTTVSENPLMSIVGHCRFKTKGSELYNVNNHPIVLSDVVGVHNGCISNDDELFALYANSGIKRRGMVDSEIIFALAENEEKEHKMHEAIQKTVKLVKGGLACAMVHRRHPHIVWLFRTYNPCDVLLYKDVGIIIWSSDKTYIHEATKGYGKIIGPAENIPVTPCSGVGIDLFRNKIHRFRLESSFDNSYNNYMHRAY